MPSILTTLVSMAAAGLTIILISGALIELSLWSAAYAVMLGLTVRDLRLWNPANSAGMKTGVETWSAELALTQLTFSPPPAEPTRNRRDASASDSTASIE